MSGSFDQDMGNIPPRPKSRATLREVAALAGVSVQTVSNHLTGRRPLRPETRQRVDAAVKTLGYRPNVAARALRSRRTASVALLLEDPNELGIHDPLHAEFFNGAAAATRAAGYDLTVALPLPGRTEQEALRLVHERRAGAVVLSLGGLEPYRERAIKTLAEEDTPVALLQQRPAIPGVFSVLAEDEIGAAEAVELLASLGHKRVAFLCGEPLWPGPARRRTAFFDAANKAGIETQDWRCASYTVDAARSAAAESLLANQRPTAVMAANDAIALGVIQQAIEVGLDVPNDLSVVGFNDFPFAAWVRPSITTVRIPGAEMGARAVELVIAALEHPRKPESVWFHTELIQRQSTGPAHA